VKGGQFEGSYRNGASSYIYLLQEKSLQNSKVERNLTHGNDEYKDQDHRAKIEQEAKQPKIAWSLDGVLVKRMV